MFDGTASVRQPGDTAPSTSLVPELSGFSVTPLRATLLYLAFGFAALFVSDALLVWYLSDPLLQQLQTIKGAVEVLLTGGLVFGLTYVSRASLRRQTDELRRHHKELRILHRILRHNFRNHLTVLQGRSEQLRDHLTTSDEVELCDEILDSIDDIIRFTEQAQEIRKVTTDQERTTYDLTSLVPSVVSSNPQVTADVTVGTHLPETARVTVHSMFDSALAELVSNAVDHHPTGSPTVEITVDPEGGPVGMTAVEIADDGPGVPDYVEQVLTAGERDELLHLDGMGLWFVYLTVVESGGHFSIGGDETGTTVTIHVPDAEASSRPEDDGQLRPEGLRSSLEVSAT